MDVTRLNENVIRKGILQSNAEMLDTLARAIDLVVIYISGHWAYYIRFEQFINNHSYQNIILVTMLLSLAFFRSFGVYRSWRGQPLLNELSRLIGAWLSVSTIVITFFYFSKSGANYSRVWIVSWIVLCILMLVAIRIIVRKTLIYLRRKGRNIRRILLIGDLRNVNRVLLQIENNDWFGLESMGTILINSQLNFLSETSYTSRLVEKIKVSLSRFENCDSNMKPDQIWIACDSLNQKRIIEILSDIKINCASIHIVPDLFSITLLNFSVDNYAGLPVMNITSTPVLGLGGIYKRLFDIVFSIIALFFLFPFCLLISVMIKIQDGGPILFKQDRYGLNGKVINILKFRTMNCENMRFKQAIKDDPRVTRIGSILRKTSLDEVPQFLNVLKGQMSIVGPRPHPTDLDNKFYSIIPRYMIRNIVKPGITGLSQISGYRGETKTVQDMRNRVDLDLEYINNWSIYLDIKIILITFIVVLRTKDVY